MNHHRRTSIFGGIFLLLCGGGFIALQLLPGFGYTYSWPWAVVMIGILLIGLGAAAGLPELIIPAVLSGGIGGILVYQELIRDYSSWLYLWALIPGFLGLGLLISRLLRGNKPLKYSDIISLLVISLFLLAVFGSFFGILGLAGTTWPVFLVGLGILLLIRPFIQKKKPIIEE